jgi:hypothetical protein
MNKERSNKEPFFLLVQTKHAGLISTFKSLHKARFTTQKVIRFAGIVIPQRICHGHFSPSPHPVTYVEEGENKRIRTKVPVRESNGTIKHYMGTGF